MEEEQKEFLFPLDDKRLVKFITFNKEQQLNSIYIGSIISEMGEERYIRLKSGVNEVARERLRQMYAQENNELREKLKRMEGNKQEREREYIKEKQEIRNTIRQEIQEEHSHKYASMEESLTNIRIQCEEVQIKRLERQNENHKQILFQKDEMERKISEQRKACEGHRL